LEQINGEMYRIPVYSLNVRVINITILLIAEYMVHYAAMTTFRLSEIFVNAGKNILFVCIIFLWIPLFSEVKNFSQESVFASHFIVHAQKGYLHDSSGCMSKWADDQSLLYLQRLKNYATEYENYRLKTNQASRHDTSYSPMGIGGLCDIYYKNIGIALDGSFLIIKQNINEEKTDAAIYDANGNKKILINYDIKTYSISPSLLFRYAFDIFSNAETYVRIGIGFDFIWIDYDYLLWGSNKDKALFEEEYPKRYQKRETGYHASIGFGYDFDIFALLCIVTYTHADFSAIKEKNSADIMRYSDGREVSTKTDMVYLSIGTGIRLSW
jgi:hypothetical protein